MLLSNEGGGHRMGGVGGGGGEARGKFKTYVFKRKMGLNKCVSCAKTWVKLKIVGFNKSEFGIY